jgi:hypothetical protein
MREHAMLDGTALFWIEGVEIRGLGEHGMYPR